MDVKNTVEIRFPKIDKIHCIADSDCSLAQIYDYACALRAFSFNKIKAEEEKQIKEEKKEEIIDG